MKSWELNKKIRKSWNMNPKTRIKGSNKQFNRGKEKSDLRKIIEENLEDEDI